MTEMKKYQSITRHGKLATHLTLEGNPEIIIQEKLDGANASFRLVEGEIKCYSRNQELDENNTLRGFYNWVQDNIDPNKLLDGVVYFGEYLVKHKLSYGDNEGKFYLFDIYNTHINEYVSFSMVKQEANKLGIKTVPVFYEGKFQSIEHIKSFVGKSQLGVQGEGVVVKNVEYRDKFGKQVFTKFVSDSFAEMQKVKKHNVSDKKDSLDEFLQQTMTEARVDKILHKLVDGQVLKEDFDITDMGTILKHAGTRVYEDIIEEELDLLLKQVRNKVGKKLPLIVKEILSEKEMQNSL